MGNSLLIDDHSFWKNIRTKVLVEGQSVSSVAQWCPTLCNPIDCSTPGFPVHHQLPELAQNHVHWVGDAIQPSHPLLSPSPRAIIFPSIRIFSNESVLWSGGPNTGASASASFLPRTIQDWFPLGLIGFISLKWNRLLRVFSNTTVEKHQFFSVQLSLWSNSCIYTWLLTEAIALTGWTFVSKVMSLLFNILSSFALPLLSRSKQGLIPQYFQENNSSWK